MHKGAYLNVDVIAVVEVKRRVDEGPHRNDSSSTSIIITEKRSGNIVVPTITTLYLDLIHFEWGCI